MIEVESISKQFGDLKAVDDVSFYSKGWLDLWPARPEWSRQINHNQLHIWAATAERGSCTCFGP